MPAVPAARWRALLELLRPDARRWVALGSLLAAGSALGLAGPLVVRHIVDRATAGTTAAEVARLALVVLAIAAVTQAVAVLAAWYATVAAWRTTNHLRLRMTEHVLGLDHEFHRRHTPGELIQRVDGDVTSVSDFLGRVVPKAFSTAVLVGGMVGVLAVLDWRLAAGMAAYLVVAFAMVVRSRDRAVGEASAEMGSYARLFGGIEERLNAAEDLRSSGASDHAMWRFVGDSADAYTSAVRRERAFLRMWWVVQGAVMAGTVLGLALGGWLVGIGTISLGTAFMLFQYTVLIARPLEQIVHELETVQKANGAMVRVLDLLAVRPTIVDAGAGNAASPMAPPPVSPPPGPLAVRFTDVHFEYGDDEPVLRAVDLDLAAGRSVGVIGRTGSGKTTWSRLVLRLVEATRGTVSLGGVPIAAIPLAELRRRVALVPQEVELFGGTVRDNVTMFDPAPNDSAVVAALERVGLDALVAGGIDRPLGPGGAGLSAGEAQLLALARVWLRAPDLVVLDEATARVDPATEARLDRAVAELVRGRTTLIIAHRLSTLQRVDEIVVFDHGRVVEHGNRSVLAAQPDSRFRRLLDLALDTGHLGAPVQPGSVEPGSVEPGSVEPGSVEEEATV